MEKILLHFCSSRCVSLQGPRFVSAECVRHNPAQSHSYVKRFVIFFFFFWQCVFFSSLFCQAHPRGAVGKELKRRKQNVLWCSRWSSRKVCEMKEINGFKSVNVNLYSEPDSSIHSEWRVPTGLFWMCVWLCVLISWMRCSQVAAQGQEKGRRDASRRNPTAWNSNNNNWKKK